jgi:hypothetical protein
MIPDGPLAGSVGQLIGVGPGRGIGLIFMVMGTLTMIVTVVAYLYPRLRLVEDELPDAISDDKVSSGFGTYQLTAPSIYVPRCGTQGSDEDGEF